MSSPPVARYDGTKPPSARREVRMSVDSVRRWKFESSPFARRGYDQHAVERFRLRVADELDLLQHQLSDLRSEVERLQAQVELHRHGVLPGSSATVAAPTAREVNLMSAAQREAEQIVAQAHDYARRVAEYAREQYAVYMRQAAEEARKEAERIVNEYRRTAGANFDDNVVTQETLRVVSEMMVSHMESAARQLDIGVQQVTRAMQAMATRPSPAIGGVNSGGVNSGSGGGSVNSDVSGG